VDTRRLGRSQHPVDFSCFGFSRKEHKGSTTQVAKLRVPRSAEGVKPSLTFASQSFIKEGPEVQPSNSLELRVRLVLSPSRWLRVEGANKEEPYPIASRVLALGEEKVEGLQPANTRVAKGACAGTRSWSYGSVRLALGVSFSR
jgi:hypothetical protein